MTYPERAFRPTSQLENLLRAWGHFFGEAKPKEWQEGEEAARADHPIARAMEYAPGRVSRGTVGRSGKGLRLITGSPPWGTDPIPCKETRSKRIATPDDIPKEVQRVQSAFLALQAVDSRRGQCLRVEYCTRGPQADKCKRIGIKLRLYRDELAHARTWVAGRLTLT